VQNLLKSKKCKNTAKLGNCKENTSKHGKHSNWRKYGKQAWLSTVATSKPKKTTHNKPNKSLHFGPWLHDGTSTIICSPRYRPTALTNGPPWLSQ